MREMKPWEVVVDRIGKSLMRLIALSFVAGYCVIAYADWPSMEFLNYSPIIALFLYYGLRGEGGLAKIGRSDLNETKKQTEERLARERSAGMKKRDSNDAP